MKQFLRNNKKTVLLFGILIVGFPLLILCPSPLGIIPRELGSVIVGYAGAILGGFLTLYGVWWTIEDNNQKRREELERQYCPILTAEIVKEKDPIYQLCSEVIVLFQHPYFLDEDPQYSKYLLKITNVGRGEIESTDLQLEDCRILAANPHSWEEELNLEGSYILGDGIFQFIPINGSFYLYVAVPKLKEEWCPPRKESFFLRIDTTLQISIEGVFSTKKQEYRLHFYLDVTFQKGKQKCKVNTMTFMRGKGYKLYD